MPSSQEQILPDAASAESSLDFIRQSFPALKRFYPSSINETWLRERYADWSIGRQGPDLQLKDANDAENFLSRFYSPSNGTFWREDYAEGVAAVLPVNNSSIIQIWNIGCGKGYETFSFACILKKKYPVSRFKIWANDSDIMAISQAPNMLFEMEEVPEFCREYMARGPNGYAFNQEIKDSVLFEYHDVVNDNSLPDLDIVLARDVISFFPVADQGKIVNEFSDRLKSHGMVILGTNEDMAEAEWRALAKPPVSAFMKRA
jgi:purine-binding chemotaxis protein CheW